MTVYLCSWRSWRYVYCWWSCLVYRCSWRSWRYVYCCRSYLFRDTRMKIHCQLFISYTLHYEKWRWKENLILLYDRCWYWNVLPMSMLKGLCRLLALSLHTLLSILNNYFQNLSRICLWEWKSRTHPTPLLLLIVDFAFLHHLQHLDGVACGLVILYLVTLFFIVKFLLALSVFIFHWFSCQMSFDICQGHLYAIEVLNRNYLHIYFTSSSNS